MDENVYTQAEVENAHDEEANLAFAFGLCKTLNVAQTVHDSDDSSSSANKRAQSEKGENVQVRRVVQALQSANNSTALRKSLEDIVTPQRYDILSHAIRTLQQASIR